MTVVAGAGVRSTRVGDGTARIAPAAGRYGIHDENCNPKRLAFETCSAGAASAQ